MKQRVKITVTKEMIDAGKRCDCEACPIALATMQAVMAPHVEVFAGGVFLFDKKNGDLLAKAKQTPEAQSFINAFDERFAVLPFTTTLVFGPANGGLFG